MKKSLIDRVLLWTVAAVTLASPAWNPAVPRARADNETSSSTVPYTLYIYIGDVPVWMGDEIRYTVPETTRVEARMMTPSGEIIVLLRLGEQEPGQYTLPWHGTAHEAQMAGVYGFELYFGDEYAARFQFIVAPEYGTP